jgi:hypothetical protein
MVEGTNNLIMNNTLHKSSISTSFGGVNPADNGNFFCGEESKKKYQKICNTFPASGI